MKAASLAALVLISSAALAGPPPPSSIKLPTMVDEPAPRPAAKPRAPGKRATAMPHVVMYATSTCPYCAKARAYMAARGIPFEERDVDSSRAINREFRQYGGRGVPLFVVGSVVLQGFSPTALDDALRRAAP